MRSALPDEVIDLFDEEVETGKTRKRKPDVLYTGSISPQRRRLVRKSKYLTSPYDVAVFESKTSELQKKVSTYAWSIELEE